MKKLMLVLFVLQTGQSFAHPSSAKSILHCWDGTFAYNTFRIEKTDKTLYVSMAGSTIVDSDAEKDFFLSNAADWISLKKFAFGGVSRKYSVAAAFPLSACQIDEKNLTFQCGAGDLDDREFTEAVYLDRITDNLGSTVSLISKFPAQRLELKASRKEMVFTRLQKFPGTGEVVSDQLNVKRYSGANEAAMLNCQNVNFQVAPKVSASLIEYIER